MIYQNLIKTNFYFIIYKFKYTEIYEKFTFNTWT